jgi:hypothetical protein
MGIKLCSNCNISSATEKMADIFQLRPILGNPSATRGERPVRYAFAGKRWLVEECESIWISSLKSYFGKKHLIALIRQAKPIELPVQGGSEKVWLTWEPHRLPGPTKRMSSLEEGTARLWLVCPWCRRKVAKLYYRLFDASRGNRSEVACRACHGLVYQSENCGGNAWYRTVARPMKRLFQDRSKLQSLKPSSRRNLLLQAVVCNLDLIRGRHGPGNSRHKRKRGSSSDRRPYRDVTVIEKYFS